MPELDGWEKRKMQILTTDERLQNLADADATLSNADKLIYRIWYAEVADKMALPDGSPETEHRRKTCHELWLAVRAIADARAHVSAALLEIKRNREEPGQ